MKEWKINEKTSEIGPKGEKGEKGERNDTGLRRPTGKSKELATKSFVIDTIEGTTRFEIVFITSLDNEIKVSNNGFIFDGLKATKINHNIVQMQSIGQFLIFQLSHVSAYLHCRAPNITQKDIKV